MRVAIISLLILCFSSLSFASFNSQTSSSPAASFDQPRFLPIDQAFVFDVLEYQDAVRLTWQVADGYYLYQSRFSVNGNNITLGAMGLKDGTPYQDKFFGEVNIYREPVTITVPVIERQASAQLIVQYQGCADAGFCYPPETRTIDLKQNAELTLPPASSEQTNASRSGPSDNDSWINTLGQSAWAPLLFLLLGIGLAFTPCVLPMYPILTSIVLGGGKISHRRALMLSFVYVQGMALTYTALGLVVASAGMQFQAALQQPAILISLSALFILLSLSMFGLYTLQLPSGLQTRLNELSNRQRGGKWAGAFIMGAISGLVCSPCTTAPLSGALLYVAQTGNVLMGGITLYALALGMGIPLIVLAVFGNRFLPKTGLWMDKVKTLFGFVLLAAALFFLERILSPLWTTALWSTLGIALFAWLYHAKNQLPFGSWKQSLIGIVAVLGLVGSIHPLWTLLSDTTAQAEATESGITFKRIRNVAELEAELATAKQSGKPVMLDFYADWCVACKEFEKYTFHEASVEQQLQGFVLLQADVTNNQPEDIQLLQHLRVLGLPTIEFWNAEGKHIAHARLTGFVKAEPFLEHLRGL